MSGYPVDLGQVLVALKETLSGSGAPDYLRDVRIFNGPWYYEPWNLYTVYLSPNGSPETTIADDGARGWVRYALHVVNVDCVKIIHDPSDEGEIVGRSGSKVGMTTFVSDVAGFLETNLLGLSGSLVESEVPPRIEFSEGAYSVLQADEDIWLQIARGKYALQTRPFLRTGVYP